MYRFQFTAMACDCENCVATSSRRKAEAVAGLALAEVRRIEVEFARARPESMVSCINASAGQSVALARLAAGALSTVSMFKGKEAIEFLAGQQVGYIAVDCNGRLHDGRDAVAVGTRRCPGRTGSVTNPPEGRW